jgi:AhpD family alkylhydroperoxidase
MAALATAGAAMTSTVAGAEERTADVKATLAEIQQGFGFVPEFMRVFPDEGLPGAWEEFKAVQLNPNTALPGKYKELIGLAVAAQIPCDYCTYFHTKAAKANGATDRELREAVAMAAIVRHWSTYLNGAQIDEAQFKKELDQIVQNAKSGAKTTTPPIVVTDAITARQDIQATLGLTPTFMKSFSDEGLAGAWKEMKGLQMNPNTAIPNKYKELIGLAVAAQIPCRYCIAFHTAASQSLFGATTVEVSETLAMAGIVRHWSTYLNGMRIDSASFRKEVDRALSAGKKSTQHASLLDGRTFVGTIVPKGKASGDPDTLIFKEGRFRSVACEKYGFMETGYASRKEGSRTIFELDVENEKGAKNHWNGSVEGKKLRATMRSMSDGSSTDFIVVADLK